MIFCCFYLPIGFFFFSIVTPYALDIRIPCRHTYAEVVTYIKKSGGGNIQGEQFRDLWNLLELFQIRRRGRGYPSLKFRL